MTDEKKAEGDARVSVRAKVDADPFEALIAAIQEVGDNFDKARLISEAEVEARLSASRYRMICVPHEECIEAVRCALENARVAIELIQASNLMKIHENRVQ